LIWVLMDLMIKYKNLGERLVLGTAGLAGIWGPVDFKESVKVLHCAWDNGILYTDTAPAYAEAESLVSKALKSWKGKLPVISTKVGKRKAEHPDATLFDYSAAYILQSVEESRRLFDRDQIDIVFLHDPGCMPVIEIRAAIDTLLELQQKGIIRSLGIGGNYGELFQPFAVSGVFDYFMGYNRYNLVTQVAAESEFPELKLAAVKIWQASPLYMGLLGRKYEDFQKELPDWIAAKDLLTAKRFHEYCQEMQLSLTGLALNYIHESLKVDRMVLGASTIKELEESLLWLGEGAERSVALGLLKENKPIVGQP
jgi:aryl-alcohol dehydrogenase-like predicted oxidoreductase